MHSLHKSHFQTRSHFQCFALVNTVNPVDQLEHAAKWVWGNLLTSHEIPDCMDYYWNGRTLSVKIHRTAVNVTAPLFTAFILVVFHVNVLDRHLWRTEMIFSSFFFSVSCHEHLVFKMQYQIKEFELLKLKIFAPLIRHHFVFLRCFWVQAHVLCERLLSVNNCKLNHQPIRHVLLSGHNSL